jgi:RHS repeat-associated protein
MWFISTLCFTLRFFKRRFGAGWLILILYSAAGLTARGQTPNNYIHAVTGSDYSATIGETRTYTYNGPNSNSWQSYSWAISNTSAGTIVYSNTTPSPSATKVDITWNQPGTWRIFYQLPTGSYPNTMQEWGSLTVTVACPSSPGTTPNNPIELGTLSACGISQQQGINVGSCNASYYQTGRPATYYRFSLSLPTRVSLNTCYSANYDTYLFLANANNVSFPFASNDNTYIGYACSPNASYLDQNLSPGTYYLIVSSATQNAGSANLALTTTPRPPTISLVDSPTGGYQQTLGEQGVPITVTGADTYTWSPSTGLDMTTGPTVKAAPATTTTYTVVGTRCGLASQSLQVQVQVNQGNYITTRVAQVQKQSAWAMINQPPAEVAVSTLYFDGLGRANQKVARAGTVTQHDLVQPITYDPLGRASITYLPYPQDINDGSIKLNAVAQQKAFYQPTTTLSRTAQDISPIAVTQYEASPLDRVLEQGAPGATWQPGTAHTNKFTQRANTAGDAVRQWNFDMSSQTYSSPGTYAPGQLLVKETRDEQDQLVTEYVDKQGKIVLKRVSLTPTVCNLISESSWNLYLAAPAGSAANVALTSIRRAVFGVLTSGTSCTDAVFDPNRSADVTSYVQGLVTLPQSSITVTADYSKLGPDPAPGVGKYLLVEAAYAAAGSSTDLLTYYLYDDLDNLRLVISPEGTNTLASNGSSWTITDDFMKNWCFRYNYDGQHRVISKQTPGTKPVLLVYNQRNQVVLTQDGNQNALGNGEWSFTKYDGLGRPIMVGTVNLPGQTQTALQGVLDTQTVFAEEVDSSPIGYSLTKAYPTNISDTNLLSITYYDRYTASPLTAPSLSCSLPDGQWLTTPRGLVTGTSIRQIMPDGTWGATWLTTASYYDAQYRVVQAIANNQLSGTNTQLMAYDFTKVLSATTTITQSGAVGYKDAKRFTYYPNTLPKETFQTLYSLNGGVATAQPEILLAQNNYNELGQLIDKRLHCTDWSLGAASKFLQKIDYRYNIRGWLTNINNRDLSANVELRPNVYIEDKSDEGVADPDLFGLQLVYNDAEFVGAAPQYNGNIAQAMWKTHGLDPGNTRNNKLRAYNYGYDPANRITSAQYHTYDKDASNNEGWDNIWQPVDFSASNITYDGNGNLLSMNRQGTVSGGDSNPTKGPLDRLTYSYKKMVGGQLIGSNQLLGVDDAVTTPSAGHDFEDNGSSYNPSGTAEYTYDLNGNLTSDANKGITNISYTRLNQPAVITFKAMPTTGNVGGMIKYTYTATGTKLTKQVFSGGSTTPTKTTSYVGPVVFESTPTTSTTPVFAQTAEGRVLYIPGTNGTSLPWKYEYHLKDQLGNLRFAFRADKDDTGVVTQIVAGMEPANAPQEERQFTHVAETRLVDPTHARTGSYVARLNARTERRQGPSIRLNLAAGDSIRAEVYARYDRENGAGNLLKKGALIAGSTIISVPGQTGTDLIKSVATPHRWLPFVGASLAIIPQLLKAKRAELPMAYLRYELFTKDSQLVATRTQALHRTATDEWQLLQAGMKADSAGFVHVSLVNETGTPAYFDDMALNKVASTPYQENHYDPFGLNLVGIEQSEVPNSAFQYNGKEKQEEFGLNWTDYGARMYDAQLGRFTEIDRFSEKYPSNSPYSYSLNNPIRFIDINGDSVSQTDAFRNSQTLSAAFNLFASTKPGRRFLSKYASAGQTIGGHTYTKDGKFHSQGVNLVFDAADQGSNGKYGDTGNNSNKNGGQVSGNLDITMTFNSSTENTETGTGFTISLADNFSMFSNLSPDFKKMVYEQTQAIFHESFIHANLTTHDYLDDGLINNSNILQSIKARIPTQPYHFQHHQVQSGDPTQLWPQDGFQGLMDANLKLHMRFLPGTITNKMNDYDGYNRK